MVRFVGVAEETTFRTYVAPTRWYDILSESLVADRGVIEPETAAYRNVRVAIAGAFKVEGDFEMFVEPKDIGLLIKALVGSVSTSGTTAPYTHTFPSGTDFPMSIPSLSLEVGHDQPTGARRIPGCVVKSMKFEAPARELLTVTVGILGAGPEEYNSTPSTPTFSDKKPFVFHQGTVLIAGATANVEALTLSIEQDIPDDAYRLGSQFLIEAIKQPAKLTVEGSMDLSFTTWDQYRRFLTGSVSGTTAGTLLGECTISAEFVLDTNNKLKFDVENAVYTASEANIDGRDRIVQSVDFKGIRSGRPILITLTNERSTP